MNNSSSTLLLKTFAKTILFAFCMVLDFGAIVLDVQNAGKTGFGEDGFAEWFQEIQVFIAFLFLVFALKKNKTLQPAD